MSLSVAGASVHASMHHGEYLPRLPPTFTSSLTPVTLTGIHPIHTSPTQEEILTSLNSSASTNPSWGTGERAPARESFTTLTPTVLPQTHVEVLSDEEQMKSPKTKATIGILSTLISYVSLNSWYKTTHPEAFIWQDEDREEDSWVKTSHSWLDRKACRWLSVCGGSHLHLETGRFGQRVQSSRKTVVDEPEKWDWQNAWTEGDDRPEDWTKDERILRKVPDYVMEYAPLVHLFSGEQFWPCDMAEHLYHVTPALNYTLVQSELQHPTLKNLDELNEWDNGRWVFLTSKDNVEERPKWLEGEKNIPSNPSDPDDKFGDNDGWYHHPGRTYGQGLKDAANDLKDWITAGRTTENDDSSEAFGNSNMAQRLEATKLLHEELKRHEDVEHIATQIRGGRSDAPAVLIVVNKGHGIVDAFWFFFYSFNLGNSVFNVRFGNHVGDWEHTCIRFQHGEPKAVFFSEHNFGSVYGYDAVEKIGKRPVIYSATGTHAMYAMPGLHPYVLPWGVLHDQTDRGPLWDPSLNSHAYTYDYKNDTLRSSNLTPQAPTEWFNYAGRWGDKFYPLADSRQYRLFGQYHYVSGPLGPKFKNLGRRRICPGPESSPCVIKHWLGITDRLKHWQSSGEEPDVMTMQTSTVE